MTPGLFDDEPERPQPQKVAPLVPPGDDVAVPRAVLAALKLTLIRIRNWNPSAGSSKSLPDWLVVECGADVQLIDGLLTPAERRHDTTPTPQPAR